MAPHPHTPPYDDVAGKDLYEMLSSLASLGLALEASPSQGSLEEDDDDEEEREGEEGGEGDGRPLDRDSATPAALARVWKRVERTLQGEALEALAPEKRAVASEIFRVLRAAYRAESIVLEEISKAEAALKGV